MPIRLAIISTKCKPTAQIWPQLLANSLENQWDQRPQSQPVHNVDATVPSTIVVVVSTTIVATTIPTETTTTTTILSTPRSPRNEHHLIFIHNLHSWRRGAQRALLTYCYKIKFALLTCLFTASLRPTILLYTFLYTFSLCPLYTLNRKPIAVCVYREMASVRYTRGSRKNS